MKSPSIKNIQGLSVYTGAVFIALVFWLFESLVKGSLQSSTVWSESFIPSEPVELWFRLFIGVIIIGLVIDLQQKAREIRRLEELLYSEQGEIKSE